MTARTTEQKSSQETPMVTLYDYFDDYTSLRIANLQPQYGLVQLNSTFKGRLTSVDVKIADLIDALRRLFPEQCDWTGGES